MLLQLRGMYIARQLSFHGVTFDIREVTIGEKFREMFDASVELVSQFIRSISSNSDHYPTVDGGSQVIPRSSCRTGVGPNKTERNVGSVLGITSTILQVPLHCSQGAPGCENNTESYCRWKGTIITCDCDFNGVLLTVCSYWPPVYWGGTHSRTTGT